MKNSSSKDTSPVNPYKKQLAQTKELSAIWTHLQQLKPSTEYFSYHNCLILEIQSLEDLSAARRLARELLPGWKGNLDQIWNPYSDCIMVSWKDSAHPLLQICLETTVQDFPAELKPDPACKLEKIERQETKYRLQCPTK